MNMRFGLQTRTNRSSKAYQSPTEKNKLKEIIIIAGPNGAGKTSFANEYLPLSDRPIVFVNADEIAREPEISNLPRAQRDFKAARKMLLRINELVAMNSWPSIESSQTFNASVWDIAGKYRPRLYDLTREADSHVIDDDTSPFFFQKNSFKKRKFSKSWILLL